MKHLFPLEIQKILFFLYFFFYSCGLGQNEFEKWNEFKGSGRLRFSMKVSANGYFLCLEIPGTTANDQMFFEKYYYVQYSCLLYCNFSVTICLYYNVCTVRPSQRTYCILNTRTRSQWEYCISSLCKNQCLFHTRDSFSWLCQRLTLFTRYRLTS